MSAFSVSNINSSPFEPITCDAWGSLNLNTTGTVQYGAGISTNTTNLGTGKRGWTLSNSNLFSSGSYAIACTQEIRYGQPFVTLNTIADTSQNRRVRPFMYNFLTVNSNQQGFTGTASVPAGASSGFVIVTEQNAIRSYNNTTSTFLDNYSSISEIPSAHGRLHLALFSLSKDDRRNSPTGNTYAIASGASGYGISGGTYHSVTTNARSQRTVTAYGTIVIPPVAGTSGGTFDVAPAYIENGFNVLPSITKTGNAFPGEEDAYSGFPQTLPVVGHSCFSVQFLNPLPNKNYSVICSIEQEPYAGVEDNVSVPPEQEYCIPVLYSGDTNGNAIYSGDETARSTNGFRIALMTQVANQAGNTYDCDFTLYPPVDTALHHKAGRTRRVHFMVFGGDTYGQP